MQPKVTTGAYVFRPLPMTSYQRKMLEAKEEFTAQDVKLKAKDIAKLIYAK